MEALYASYSGPEANFFPGVLPALLLVAGLVLLLPWVLRQRWPGVSEGASGSADPPASPHAVARWAMLAAVVASAAFGVLHVAGFLVARWSTRLPVFDAVLTLCQSVNPSMWLAPVAGLAVLLWLRSRPALPLPGAHYSILGLMLLVSYLLAFGPTVSSWESDLGAGPYRLLHEFAPPYRSIRAAGRFGFFWMLFVAAMVGASLAAGARLLRPRFAPTVWRGLRLAAIGLVSAVLLFEYRAWPLPTVEASPSASAVDVWLAEQSDVTSVIHMPLAPEGHPPFAARYLLDSTLHFLPMVNGYSGFFPATYGRSIVQGRAR